MKLVEFMNSVTKRRTAERKATEEEGKKKELNTRTNRISFVPTLVLVVANIAVLSLDIRVYDAIYKITHSHLLAGFSIFPTGVMFMIWYDVLFSNYPLQTPTQKNISLAGAGFSLAAAAVFAFFDYGVTIDIGSGRTVGIDNKIVFWSTIILTVLHVVCLFWWHAIDEDVKARKEDEKDLATQRRKANMEEAQSRITLEMMETANTVLDSLRAAMLRQKQLENEFGSEEVGKMMKLLAGIEIATNTDINGDGVIGKPVQPAAPMPTQTRAYAADSGQMPTVEPENPTVRRPN